MRVKKAFYGDDCCTDHRLKTKPKKTLLSAQDVKCSKNPSNQRIPGAGIMEADDRQVTTVFTVIPPSALGKPSIMNRYHRR